MDKKEIIINQFNRQAERFSKWSVTKNTEYMRRYLEFCEFTKKDSLLDVACGSGEFLIFCADKINYAIGVDISEKMIELAKDEERKHKGELL